MKICKRLAMPSILQLSALLILIQLVASLAPVAVAQGDKTVGGHIGFGFPLVTRTGDDTTTIRDFFQMSLPVGSGCGAMTNSDGWVGDGISATAATTTSSPVPSLC